MLLQTKTLKIKPTIHKIISDHIEKIYADGELPQEGTNRKFRLVRVEGKREVEREISHYNLDMIISVGYKVNSKSAVNFRIWATQKLTEFIVTNGNFTKTLKASGDGAEPHQMETLLAQAHKATLIGWIA